MVAYGNDLLSRGHSDVRRVIASGRGTTLRTGVGKRETTIWGDRFQLDVPTSTATLEGAPDRDLLVQRGPDANPRAFSEQKSISIDIDTGDIRDVDQLRFILRGGGK